MVDIFEIAEEEYRQDLIATRIRRSLPYLLATGIVAILIAFAYNYHISKKNLLIEEASSLIYKAYNDAEQKKYDEALLNLDLVIKQDKVDFLKSIAIIDKAAILIAQDKKKEATEILTSLSDDNSVDAYARNIAKMMLVNLEDKPMEVKEGEPFYYDIKLLEANNLLNAGKTTEAKAVIQKMISDPNMPEVTKQRVQAINILLNEKE